MRGEVISVDGLSGDGIISGEDGARYTFAAASTRSSLQAGDRVDFVPLDGAATEIMMMASAARPAATTRPTQPYDAAYNFGWAMFAVDGRLRRSHYWISWGILTAVGFVAGFIPFFGALVSLVLIWPNIAVSVKRFHDMGRSGWWLAVPWGVGVVAVIGMFMTIGISAFSNPGALESEDPATMMAVMGPALLFILIAWLVSFGFWLWLGIADSQPGRNKYGRNPKNPHGDDAEVFA